MQKKIPETCPGTESQAAGTADGCAGCPNQNACKTAPKGPDPDLQIIKEKFQSTIKSKILVLSGKGGVGKSTFTANLANALASDESKQIGLLDIDLCGPSIPRMMGLVGEQIHNSAAGWSPVYSSDNLAVMSIGFLLQNHDDAVIWRGPKKNGLIKQFLKDVDWATPEQPLDYLLVDTPPGTSDEHISLVQYLKNTGVDGAVLITTPQYLSIQDVIKEINFCKKVGIHVIGVVENMSGFICPNPKCSKESLIFPPSTTCNVQQMAKDMDVNYLGSIPLDTRIAKSCDLGESFLDLYPDSIASKAYIKIIDGIKSNLSSRG